MNRYSKYALFIVEYCLLGCGLIADTIPTLTASSASAAIGIAEGCTSSAPGCRFVFSAGSDFFTLSASGFSGGDFRLPGVPLGFLSPTFNVSAGQTLPPSQGFGQVTLAGVTYQVLYSGSALISAPEVELQPLGGVITATSFTVSSGNITAPPITPSSPGTTIILPATIQGTFAACVVTTITGECASSSPTVSDISIELSGDLMFGISVFYTGTTPEYTDISESFVSTPVPEPASIVLIAPSVMLLAGIHRKRCRRADFRAA